MHPTRKALGVLLISMIVEVNSNQRTHREKRMLGIFKFGLMVRCATKRHPFSYTFYGCWCGIGGGGKIVDETDRCCYHHDQCYEDAIRRGDCQYYEWFITNYSRIGCTGCSLENSRCGKAVCRCDQKAAECFRRAAFHRKNMYYKLNIFKRC
ncbi:basic phospholipase A2 taipoxin alpha chain-like [Xenia sp. Carnegie-2017]|uniref:basic phospholipase A2 taipoxin alpha chain-like n=1 Tax=Xenia sp. Carnegie-2017 TaxID=2897299 RepID=UPI001F042D52|nr:basic phospholipase A2 taipoxin alpha chain-like [Xenia sp. Carnegie-2017]